VKSRGVRGLGDIVGSIKVLRKDLYLLSARKLNLRKNLITTKYLGPCGTNAGIEHVH
jgi:hypothetical protein